jgi:hypothetical protein
MKLKEYDNATHCLKLYLALEDTPSDQYKARAYITQALLLHQQASEMQGRKEAALAVRTAVAHTTPLMKGLQIASTLRNATLCQNIATIYWSIVKHLFPTFARYFTADILVIIKALEDKDGKVSKARLFLVRVYAKAFSDDAYNKLAIEKNYGSELDKEFGQRAENLRTSGNDIMKAVKKALKVAIAQSPEERLDLIGSQICSLKTTPNPMSRIDSDLKMDYVARAYQIICCYNHGLIPENKVSHYMGEVENLASIWTSLGSTESKPSKTASAVEYKGEKARVLLEYADLRLRNIGVLVDTTYAGTIDFLKKTLSYLAKVEKSERLHILFEFISVRVNMMEVEHTHMSESDGIDKHRIGNIERIIKVLEFAFNSVELNTNLIQNGCIIIWNICIPFIKKKARSKCIKYFLYLAKALDSLESPLLHLRGLIHLETAKYYEEINSLGQGLAHANNAMKLLEKSNDEQNYEYSLHNHVKTVQYYMEIRSNPNLRYRDNISRALWLLDEANAAKDKAGSRLLLTQCLKELLPSVETDYEVTEDNLDGISDAYKLDVRVYNSRFKRGLHLNLFIDMLQITFMKEQWDLMNIICTCLLSLDLDVFNEMEEKKKLASTYLYKAFALFKLQETVEISDIEGFTKKMVELLLLGLNNAVELKMSWLAVNCGVATWNIYLNPFFRSYVGWTNMFQKVVESLNTLKVTGNTVFVLSCIGQAKTICDLNETYNSQSSQVTLTDVDQRTPSAKKKTSGRTSGLKLDINSSPESKLIEDYCHLGLENTLNNSLRYRLLEEVSRFHSLRGSFPSINEKDHVIKVFSSVLCWENIKKGNKEQIEQCSTDLLTLVSVEPWIRVNLLIRLSKVAVNLQLPTVAMDALNNAEKMLGQYDKKSLKEWKHWKAVIESLKSQYMLQIGEIKRQVDNDSIQISVDGFIKTLELIVGTPKFEHDPTFSNCIRRLWNTSLQLDYDGKLEIGKKVLSHIPGILKTFFPKGHESGYSRFKDDDIKAFVGLCLYSLINLKELACDKQGYLLCDCLMATIPKHVLLDVRKMRMYFKAKCGLDVGQVSTAGVSVESKAQIWFSIANSSTTEGDMVSSLERCFDESRSVSDPLQRANYSIAIGSQLSLFKSQKDRWCYYVHQGCSEIYHILRERERMATEAPTSMTKLGCSEAIVLLRGYVISHNAMRDELNKKTYLQLCYQLLMKIMMAILQKPYTPTVHVEISSGGKNSKQNKKSKEANQPAETVVAKPPEDFVGWTRFEWPEHCINTVREVLEHELDADMFFGILMYAIDEMSRKGTLLQCFPLFSFGKMISSVCLPHSEAYKYIIRQEIHALKYFNLYEEAVLLWEKHDKTRLEYSSEFKVNSEKDRHCTRDPVDFYQLSLDITNFMLKDKFHKETSSIASSVLKCLTNLNKDMSNRTTCLRQLGLAKLRDGCALEGKELLFNALQSSTNFEHFISSLLAILESLSSNRESPSDAILNITDLVLEKLQILSDSGRVNEVEVKLASATLAFNVAKMVSTTISFPFDNFCKARQLYQSSQKLFLSLSLREKYCESLYMEAILLAEQGIPEDENSYFLRNESIELFYRARIKMEEILLVSTTGSQRTTQSISPAPYERLFELFHLYSTRNSIMNIDYDLSVYQKTFETKPIEQKIKEFVEGFEPNPIHYWSKEKATFLATAFADVTKKVDKGIPNPYLYHRYHQLLSLITSTILKAIEIQVSCKVDLFDIQTIQGSIANDGKLLFTDDPPSSRPSSSKITPVHNRTRLLMIRNDQLYRHLKHCLKTSEFHIGSKVAFDLVNNFINTPESMLLFRLIGSILFLFFLALT